MEMKRVGSFNIEDSLVFREDEAIMKAVCKLLGEVFICSAIHNFGYGRFEYIGMSKHFDVIEEGCIAPAYVICLANKEGDVSA